MRTTVLRHAEVTGNTLRRCEFSLFRTEYTLSISEHRIDYEEPKEDPILLADVFITCHVYNDSLATNITPFCAATIFCVLHKPWYSFVAE
jgi:hypothetical protein